MLQKASVPYWGSLAHYAITPDDFGIYHARLLKYEGPGGITPPQCFMMMRSLRRWISSCEDQGLINDLGRAIDHRPRGGNPHIV